MSSADSSMAQSAPAVAWGNGLKAYLTRDFQRGGRTATLKKTDRVPQGPPSYRPRVVPMRVRLANVRGHHSTFAVVASPSFAYAPDIWSFHESHARATCIRVRRHIRACRISSPRQKVGDR